MNSGGVMCPSDITCQDHRAAQNGFHWQKYDSQNVYIRLDLKLVTPQISIQIWGDL